MMQRTAQLDEGLHSDEVEFNLAALVHRLIAGRWVVLRFVATGLVLGGLLAFLLPVWYRAQAVFLPPSTTDVTTTSPMAAFFTRQDPSDMYLGMLTSRSVADDVIDHLGLMSVFRVQRRADARAALAASSKFTVDKNALIAVSVTSRDPVLAAKIANAYLDALYRLNGAMAASGYRYREEFFEAQLAREKDALNEAEASLQMTQEKTGVVLPQGEAMAGVSATAQLQAQVGAAETRLAELRLRGTDNNPEVIQARTQVAMLRGQMARQQASKGAMEGLASTAKLPGLALENERSAREVKLREGIYDAVTQQYEKARIAAADPGPQLQVVDRAVPPERKAGPPRRLILVGGIAIGLLLGLLYVLLRSPVRGFLRMMATEAGRA